MSFRVLVIPEDPTYNGYILTPLVERLLREAGRPNARVKLLTNPRLQGYAAVLEAVKESLASKWRFMDLWLFIPDGDQSLNADALEQRLQAQGVRLLVCPAVPELEAWLLAGHREKLSMPWNEVRSHPRLKEEVFDPFLREHGIPEAPGGGREELMKQALGNLRGITAVCPELARLLERLKEVCR